MADKKGALAAGVAGAVIGAAAAAAAIALSDEKNRKKAEKVLADLQKQGSSLLKEISRKAMQLREAGQKAVSRVQGKPKKVAPKGKKKE